MVIAREIKSQSCFIERAYRACLIHSVTLKGKCSYATIWSSSGEMGGSTLGLCLSPYKSASGEGC